MSNKALNEAMARFYNEKYNDVKKAVKSEENKKNIKESDEAGKTARKQTLNQKIHELGPDASDEEKVRLLIDSVKEESDKGTVSLASNHPKMCNPKSSATVTYEDSNSDEHIKHGLVTGTCFSNKKVVTNQAELATIAQLLEFRVVDGKKIVDYMVDKNLQGIFEESLRGIYPEDDVPDIIEKIQNGLLSKSNVEALSGHGAQKVYIPQSDGSYVMAIMSPSISEFEGSKELFSQRWGEVPKHIVDSIPKDTLKGIKAFKKEKSKPIRNWDFENFIRKNEGVTVEELGHECVGYLKNTSYLYCIDSKEYSLTTNPQNVYKGFPQKISVFNGMPPESPNDRERVQKNVGQYIRSADREYYDRYVKAIEKVVKSSSKTRRCSFFKNLSNFVISAIEERNIYTGERVRALNSPVKDDRLKTILDPTGFKDIDKYPGIYSENFSECLEYFSKKFSKEVFDAVKKYGKLSAQSLVNLHVYEEELEKELSRCLKENKHIWGL